MGGADYGVGGKGYIRALDYQTGQVRWSHEIGGGSGAGVLTTTTGLTFTGDGSGNALALRTRDGRRCGTRRSAASAIPRSRSRSTDASTC